jgi:hypothetical protein
MGRFPSGQRGQTVNLLASPSKVRILLSPPLLKALPYTEGLISLIGIEVYIDEQFLP